MTRLLTLLFCMLTVNEIAAAQQPAAPLPEPDFSQDAPWPEALFEIFRLEPGQHEAFVRSVHDWDQVNAAAGLPPARLYFHSHGAEWDVLILKVIDEQKLTPDQEAAMAAKIKELGLPTGPAFFIQGRKHYASHTDTQAVGPISAAQWLAKLDAWRKDNPGREPQAQDKKKR